MATLTISQVFAAQTFLALEKGYLDQYRPNRKVLRKLADKMSGS
jgi:hypothetical protein